MNGATNILIVEDSPSDFEMATRSLGEAGLNNPLYHCTTGDDALDFLYREGPYQDPAKSPRPGLILLDLNLPGTDGRELLQIVKQDEALSDIPVLVLTTSNDARDVDECYRLGANSYVTKPVTLEGFVSAMTRLKNWWFEIVVLPDNS